MDWLTFENLSKKLERLYIDGKISTAAYLAEFEALQNQFLPS